MSVNSTLRCLLIVAAVVVGTSVTAPVGIQAATSEVDRELVVRFTRAYGMAKAAFEKHSASAPTAGKRDAMLRQPDRLERSLRREIDRILDLNGVERDEWQMMLARMETDEELRRRVESLASPFE